MRLFAPVAREPAREHGERKTAPAFGQGPWDRSQNMALGDSRGVLADHAAGTMISHGWASTPSDFRITPQVAPPGFAVRLIAMQTTREEPPPDWVCHPRRLTRWRDIMDGQEAIHDVYHDSLARMTDAQYDYSLVYRRDLC